MNRFKIKLCLGVAFLILLCLVLWILFSGGNFEILRSIINSKDLTQEELQEMLYGFGWRGYIAISALAMLQVVFTFLPAEPVQVIAGVAFGFPIGILLCTIGVLLGNAVIFILYKIFGRNLGAFFGKKLHIDIDKIGRGGRVVLIVFILYFLPAIPYGMICFFAAVVGMNFPRYLTVTVLGAIPSVAIGVGLGHLAMNASWTVSICVFAVLVVLLIIMFIKKNTLFEKLNNMANKTKAPKTAVRKYPSRRLLPPFIVSKIALFFKGVKVKYTKKVKKLEKPSIVLCNHGSFLDFIYAGSLIRKQSPNFIVARLYFYKKFFNDVLRRIGCFPKSMFAQDLESAKNCLRVLKNNGILAMMPEARLSTAGKFEDIQPSTFNFLKSAGVNIYYIKINGSYLAKPKWGDKMRRGACVEATLDMLISKEELINLSVEEIQKKVEDALYFDEMKWLESKPKIKYKSKTIAVGLENILTRCPSCGARYSLATDKNQVSCTKCGLSATIDNRYKFVDNKPFDSFDKWYDWQVDELKSEIESNKDFKLESKVVLKHPSRDGKKSLYVSGEGVCTLNREGLTYKGTRDNENVEKHFDMSQIYRLLFGSGENFEIYEGKEIYYFVPEEKKSCVDWYIASKLLKELSAN